MPDAALAPAAVLGALVDLDAPSGPAWEFLVLFAVVVAGPRIVERAKGPGIVGLLLGGYAIGPHGLGFIPAGDQTIPEIGQVGLLYLMFVAGVELDLGLLARHRRSTVAFGLLTFALPMAAGTAVGLALGWEAAAAVLLGSLLASHTLIALPAVKDAGHGADPATATAVGATVLTDTVALVVLAGVSGTETGDGSAASIAFGIAVGLAVLGLYAFVALPRLAGWALRTFGADRAVRYLVAVCGFLSAATVSEVFGIEGIVGAFAAGLALNRLVPNEGPLMAHIELFGAAVFVPVFLVSVGLILDPGVMVEGRTLGYAALIVGACVGGKALAAALGARVLGFTRAQGILLFALTTPQAAATLASTIVGFQIGLFSTSVVNAVLVLILASIVVATVAVGRVPAGAGAAEPAGRPLGAHVVLALAGPDAPPAAFAVAGALAAPDGGCVDTVLVAVGPGGHPGGPALERLGALSARAGADGLATLRVDRSFAHAVVDAAVSHRASAVVVVDPGPAAASPAAWASAVAGRAPVPVVVVRGGGSERLHGARLVAPPGDGAGPEVRQLAAEVAARLGTCAQPPEDDAHGHDHHVTVVPVGTWEALADVPAPVGDDVVVVVPPPATPAGATAAP